MRHSGRQPLFFLVVLAAAIGLACGSSTRTIPVVCSVPASGNPARDGNLKIKNPTSGIRNLSTRWKISMGIDVAIGRAEPWTSSSTTAWRKR